MAKRELFGVCPYVTSQKVLTGKWSIYILYLLSQESPIRFNELQRRMPEEMTHTTLSRQLQTLQAEGLIERIEYLQIPPKVEYSLSDIGRKFGKVLDALGEWGKEYIEYMETQSAKIPVLETERLRLRQFTMEDAKALFLILKDKEANTFLPWFPVETLKETEAFIQKRFLERYQRSTPYQYAICLKEDNLPIGMITVGEDESHDLGYSLRTEFWHKGIVTEGCKAVVEQLRQAGFSFITATHDTKNGRSGEVMKKLGMTYRYSYKEYTKPKEELVTFRMYQLDFVDLNGWDYRGHLKNSLDGNAFVEEI